MNEKDEFPAIDMDKLEERAHFSEIKQENKPQNPEGTPIPSRIWTFLAGPWMKAFIIIEAIAIVISLVGSFSSLYIVLTYPGLIFTIIMLITMIQLHRGALVALREPEQAPVNIILMKRLYYMYFWSFIFSIIVVIFTMIFTFKAMAMEINNPIIWATAQGVIIFIILLAILFGYLIVYQVKRYLNSIISTVTESIYYHKSGSIFLMVMCYIGAFSNLLNIMSPQDANNGLLEEFAIAIGLNYVPVNSSLQILSYLVSLVLTLLIARFLRISREFDS
jgi:hypothetical protein